MPWHLPGDLAHFRRATLGSPLLMGRRTFEAIGRPLPGREMIVVSADPAFAPAGLRVGRTLDEALALADRSAHALGAAAIMVAGGGTIYRALIGRAATLLITAVDAAPDGDTFFPPIDPDVWRLSERQSAVQQPDDSVPFSIARYDRLSPPGNKS